MRLGTTTSWPAGWWQRATRLRCSLIQNAVLAARPAAQTPQLKALVGSGVKVLADDFALKERGITKLLDGIETAPIEVVVDHLEAGHKTLWH